jgi:hypothetical protein
LHISWTDALWTDIGNLGSLRLYQQRSLWRIIRTRRWISCSSHSKLACFQTVRQFSAVAHARSRYYQGGTAPSIQPAGLRCPSSGMIQSLCLPASVETIYGFCLSNCVSRSHRLPAFNDCRDRSATIVRPSPRLSRIFDSWLGHRPTSPRPIL